MLTEGLLCASYLPCSWATWCSIMVLQTKIKQLPHTLVNYQIEYIISDKLGPMEAMKMCA
jgi:hypothetical protein